MAEYPFSKKKSSTSLAVGATNTFTYTLTNGELVIAASNNVLRLSVLTRQGTVTILGNIKFQGLDSSPVTWSAGQGATLTAGSTSTPLDGITITAASGGDIADIIITYQ